MTLVPPPPPAPEPTGARFNSPREAALYYHDLGFSVFVIRNDPPKDRKKPAVNWELYQTMRASKIQIDRWYSKNPNYNLAIATGNSSMLVVLDIDEEPARKRVEEKRLEMSTNLRVALDTTMKVKTGSGRGVQIFFRFEEPIDFGDRKLWSESAKLSGCPRDPEIRLKAQGYVVLPPSLHESGNHYEQNDKPLQLLTRQELNELIKLLSPQAVAVGDKNERVVATTSTNLSHEPRTLTDKQAQELMQWISPYYNPGCRNDIIYYLSGMFRIGGFSQDTARAFVTELCNSSPYQDEDLEKSLEVVSNTYEKAAGEVKGKSGLHQTLVGGFEGDGDNMQEYLARCETYSRICQIFNHYPPPPPPPPKEKQVQPQSQPGETDTETKVRGLTETLERHYKFAAIEETDELFYFVDNKGYAPAGPLVKAQVEKQYPGVITATVTNVIEKLVRRYLTPRAEFDKDIYILNMANGLYDIRTNTLRPHTWEYPTLASNQLPIKFDPKAWPKKFGKFVGEVVYPQQVRTVIEAMAYTFLRDNPFEIYNILVGFGSNGKSVLMYVLAKLHGEDNVSNTSLKTLLNDKFAMRDLEGKNVNVDMEMSGGTIMT